ncbi:hypothetical protein ABE85_14615 [Mitsuaria sp. 7]|nr:hypothetical protein ABE85_14615 [Mitsuaria sp. 7]
MPPRRSSAGYERPESLFVRNGSTAHKDYVLIEVRPDSGGVIDAVNAGRTEDPEVIQRQGALLDKAMTAPLRSSIGVTIPDVKAAAAALLAPKAWHQARAFGEGQHPLCAVPSDDATALARALLVVPMELLSARERESMTEARKALASHQPYKMLQLTPEAVRHLGLALDAVTRLVVSQEELPPALPKRNPATARLPATAIASGG